MVSERVIPVERDHDLAQAKAIQDYWAMRTVREMEKGLIPSRTLKLNVGGVDFYVHVGYLDGVPVHIMVDGFKEDDNRQRAPLELLCEQVSDGMRRGLFGLEEVLATWRGTSFAPCGRCPQLGDRFVGSPLDAIGWYLMKGEGDGRG